MVQIIQSGPSQATLRQQALDQATQNILGGLSAYQTQQKQDQETKRQQALKALDTTLNLRAQGYDVTPDQVSQMYSQPQAGFGGLFDKRTAEYTAKQEQAAKDRDLKERASLANLAKTEAEIEKLKRVDPFEAEKKKLELQKLQADISTSPIARRKAEAEIKKLEAEATKSAKEALLPGGKPATEGQQKAGGFAERMLLAEQELKAIPGDIGTSAAYTYKGSSFYPDVLKSEEQKLYEQAKNNFITANLRLESGAAIGKDEYATEERKYFPQPGDTPRVLQQKERARAQAIQNLRNMAGAAAPSDSVSTRQAAQGQPKTVVQNGFTYTLNEATGQYE